MSEQLNIAELLDISGLPGAGEGEEMVVYEKMELVDVESHPGDRKGDLEDDYSLARKTAHHMNQMLISMAEIALHNAKNSESPRHVEAFTSLMAQVQTANAGLLKIHKEMKEITEEKTPTGDKPGEGGGTEKPNMNFENATVFVGSPTELMQQVGSAYDTKPQKPVIDAEEAEDAEVVEDGNERTGNESGSGIKPSDSVDGSEVSEDETN